MTWSKGFQEGILDSAHAALSYIKRRRLKHKAEKVQFGLTPFLWTTQNNEKILRKTVSVGGEEGISKGKWFSSFISFKYLPVKLPLHIYKNKKAFIKRIK